ncbi:hypothetical protein V8B55DRAFT_1325561 [Mucor lusitanicus]|uniref:Uncharacterized protein n=2 Tax=Mucor circinelloides f. lusitanicus TaxID=29924 RepID=A0A168PPW6_MUCCL|nr:hypothetical protein FB192DRAFT_1471831 [Mucor lusitanicus]OAD08044.1 hypothetical protein MUCCIDRAFT_158282 [Mucor lusitanicus CBS 277.49]
MQVDKDDNVQFDREESVQFDEEESAVQDDSGSTTSPPIYDGLLERTEVELVDGGEAYDQVRSNLIYSVNAYMMNKKLTPVNYKSSGKSTHMELMLQEACSITHSSKVDGTDINFLKLVLSNSMNLMGSAYRRLYVTLLPKSFIDPLYPHCADRRQEFIFSALPIETGIDSIFDAMQPFQFEYFSECGVTNFATLNKARDSEAMYCGTVRSLVEILLKGTGLKAIDGELTRVDLILYKLSGSEEIEYSSIKFKKANARTTLLDDQQAKNIRSMQQF